MPKYIDLGKQLVRLYRLNLTCKDVIKEFLLSAEIADVVEVVKCKDCIYGKSANDGTVFCRADTIHAQYVWRDQDWFCASGKERG